MPPLRTTPADWLSAANRTDASWMEGVRALPVQARRDVLAHADRFTIDSAGSLSRTLDVYEALSGQLDPSDLVDAARIRRLVDGRRVGTPALEAVFERTAQACADPALSLEAAAIAAQHAAHRGDTNAADRLYALLFMRVRGRGGRAEAAAFVNYARYCLAGGREFEALAASRRAESLFLALDDPWGVALARLHRSGVIQSLHDWVRLAAAIESVEAMLPRLSERETKLAQTTLHDRRAHLAWARGRTDEAVRHVDAAEEILKETGLASSSFVDPRRGDLIRVRVWVAGKRSAQAVAAADRAIASGRADDSTGLLLRCARLGAWVDLRADGIEAEANSILDACCDPERAPRPGHVRECATQVAHVLATVPAALRTMRHAFDVAASAAFDRAVEVDRFVHQLPEAAPLLDDDAETLSDHRRATLAEQVALGTAVALSLERAGEAGRSPLPMFGDADGLTCVCAWCQRVRTRDGLWLTVQQFLPLRSAGSVQLTHGICETCAPALAAQVASVVP